MHASTPRHILVVEDHAVFRRFLLSWLSRSYDVTAVSDGFEALQWLQAGNTPDVVLLDMEMPRMCGSEFLKNIRYSGIFRDLPVVALTSKSAEETHDECDNLPLDAVFAKPYQPDALLEAIATASTRLGQLQAA